jgi:hypothetical protein
MYISSLCFVPCPPVLGWREEWLGGFQDAFELGSLGSFPFSDVCFCIVWMAGSWNEVGGVVDEIKSRLLLLPALRCGLVMFDVGQY